MVDVLSAVDQAVFDGLVWLGALVFAVDAAVWDAVVWLAGLDPWMWWALALLAFSWMTKQAGRRFAESLVRARKSSRN